MTADLYFLKYLCYICINLFDIVQVFRCWEQLF